MADIFQSIDQQDSGVQSMVVDRLEARAAMPAFVAIREAYLDRVDLQAQGRILELGCGTGPVCRAIADRAEFSGEVIGSDLSQHLIDAARKLTDPAAYPQVSYLQADGQGAGDAEYGEVDMVLAHTVISHVADPGALLAECVRRCRPGGRIVVHDGDYASMTLRTGAGDIDRKMSAKIIAPVVANLDIMRDFPGLPGDLPATIVDVAGDVLVAVGEADYFANMARSYGPVAVRAGLIDEAVFGDWLTGMDRAVAENRFFGSCNFVTYVLQCDG